MTQQPAISFILPVRNDPERLARCLDSIRASAAGRAIELVVGDNGSTDGTSEVARRAGAAVLSLPGLRVSAVRNRAAAAASADLLAFVDADHELAPGWVEAALDTMKEDAVAGAGALYTAPPAGTWVQRSYGALRGQTFGRSDVDWLGSGNLVVKRVAFDSVGGFDESLEACEDVDLCQRLRGEGWRLVGDERLKSIHHGDPPTLSRLFRSELWRGRDNIRVSLRGRLTLRALPGLVFPVLQLLAVVLVIGGLLSDSRAGAWTALVGALTIAGTVALRTAVILRRRRQFGPSASCQALATAATYDAARALSVIWHVEHHREQRR